MRALLFRSFVSSSALRRLFPDGMNVMAPACPPRGGRAAARCRSWDWRTTCSGRLGGVGGAERGVTMDRTLLLELDDRLGVEDRRIVPREALPRDGELPREALPRDGELPRRKAVV